MYLTCLSLFLFLKCPFRILISVSHSYLSFGCGMQVFSSQSRTIIFVTIILSVPIIFEIDTIFFIYIYPIIYSSHQCQAMVFTDLQHPAMSTINMIALNKTILNLVTFVNNLHGSLFLD